MVDTYTDEVYKKRKRAAGRQGLIDHLPTVGGGGEGKTNGKTVGKGGKGKNKVSPGSSEDSAKPVQGVDSGPGGVDARIEVSGEEEAESDVDKYARGFKIGPGADDSDDSDGDEAGDEMTEKE